MQKLQKKIQKRCENDAKTMQKRSKIDAKTMSKRSKNDAKTIQKRCKNKHVETIVFGLFFNLLFFAKFNIIQF